MLFITPTLSIPEDRLDEKFVRAPGAGGQNVNKVATAGEASCGTDRAFSRIFW